MELHHKSPVIKDMIHHNITKYSTYASLNLINTGHYQTQGIYMYMFHSLIT